MALIRVLFPANSDVTKHGFSFDKVFAPNSKQTDIFEMVAPMIQSALDGYSICIFAYGQTGGFFDMAAQ